MSAMIEAIFREVRGFEKILQNASESLDENQEFLVRLSKGLGGLLQEEAQRTGYSVVIYSLTAVALYILVGGLCINLISQHARQNGRVFKGGALLALGALLWPCFLVIYVVDEEKLCMDLVKPRLPEVEELLVKINLMDEKITKFHARNRFVSFNPRIQAGAESGARAKYGLARNGFGAYARPEKDDMVDPEDFLVIDNEEKNNNVNITNDSGVDSAAKK